VARLAGKVVIVTGAARGQGAATVRLFLAEGARVIGGDVLDQEGEALARELAPGTFLYLHQDVSIEADWAAAVDLALARFGRIDVLINNAGIRHHAALESLTRAGIESVLAINLVGPMLGMAAVTPAMKRQRSGAIINISSIDGLRGSNGKAAYIASKWGLRGVTKGAAIELGHHGIRVNSIHPGGVDTPMANPNAVPRADYSRHFRDVPLQRVGEAEEIARASLYLASDEASYVSGAELAVDGGWSAGYIQRMAPGAPPA
jgi:3alpha(or 20beta)-hydroxysteroid dehydrogenase